jgi:transcriptional regulator with XRE-family HTH domain
MSANTVGHGWRPSDDTFGARLALIRQAKGWSMTQAAQECGVPMHSWRRWERNADRPRDYIELCTRIAARTDVDLAWLAGISPGHSIAS